MGSADSLNSNRVLFRYGLVGALGQNNNGNFGGNLPANNYAPATATSNNGQYGTGSNGPQIVAYGTSDTGTTSEYTYRGSIYSAVGALSNGRPLVAWYDNASQQLIFSYGNGAPTTNNLGGTINNGNGNLTTSWVNTTTAQWQTNARPIPGTSAKGNHVDMAVDGDDNVHLAYYDVINGGLYYTYIPSASVIPTTTGDTTGIITVSVDTYLAAGTKLMLNVRQETHGTETRYVPYISYFHNSFGETRNSIRVAWRSDFSDLLDGTNEEDDSFTGAWEVMTVPAANTPLIGEFVCNGVPTSGTLDTGGTSITHTNATRSILVGYMTDTRYEGAILKRQLW